MIRFSVLVVDN